MRKGFKRPWENDQVRTSTVVALGLLWMALFYFINAPSEASRQLEEEFAFRRLAESAVLQHDSRPRVPDRIANLFGIDDESLIEETGEIFDGAVESGDFPVAVAADWGVMFLTIGDEGRATRARNLIDESDPVRARQGQIMEVLLGNEVMTPGLQNWAERRFRQGVSQLPEWLLLRERKEEIRLWMEEKGSAILRRGIAADLLVVLLGALSAAGAILFLARWREFQFSGMPFRLPRRGWRTRHLLREVFLSELLGLLLAVLLAAVFSMVGWSTLSYLVAVLAVFLFPMILLNHRLTPGWRAAVRLFRVRVTGWTVRALSAFCGIGLTLLALGTGGIILFDDGSSSVSDSISRGELDTWGNVLMSYFVAVVLAPIGEEWVFRGFFFGGLRHRIGPVAAGLVSSLCFAALHGYSILGLLAVFFYGLVFCWLYHRSGSLLPGILVHAIYNALVTAQVSGWHSFH